MNYLTKSLLAATTGILLFADVIINGQSSSSGIAGRCYDNDTGIPICFSANRNRSLALKTWDNASALCEGGGGTLPRVTSTKVQLRLAEFLYENGFTFDSIWLGGRGSSGGSTSSGSNSDWHWVNASRFPSTGVIGSDSNFDKSVAVITVDSTGNASIVAMAPGPSVDGYICQFTRGYNCTEQPYYSDGVNCFRLFVLSGNWFTSRNRCLYDNGDLATLNDTTTTGLNEFLARFVNSFSPGKTYWLGLRKIWWQWQPDMSEHDATFFVDQSLSIENTTNADGNCLSVDYKNQFAWTIRNCSVPLQTVCQTSALNLTDGETSLPSSSSSSSVTLPAWAVGVISGCVGVFFIVSLIVVAVVASRCCRHRKTETIGNNHRGGNNYVREPVHSIHPPPIPSASNLSIRNQQPTTPLPSHSPPPPPPPLIDDIYDEFDDDEYENNIPSPSTSSTTTPGEQYMNHSQAKAAAALGGRKR